MLLPGPEAHQLAIYVGWLLNGTPGALAAGVFFLIRQDNRNAPCRCSSPRFMWTSLAK
jgi:hypothetical protein